MTCLEAQSNIMAFIDNKLPDERIAEFVHHVRYCPNCMEELEIYYTLIVGMRQLDNNDELSHDFKQQLNNELERLENKVKNAKRAKVSTFGVVFGFAVVLLLFFYNQCLFVDNEYYCTILYKVGKLSFMIIIFMISLAII